MRARAFVVAGALLGVVACAKFGADTPDADPESVVDAGSKSKDAGSSPSVVNDAAGGDTDAPDAGSLLPADAFGEVSYDRLDGFERADLPGGGPFDWDPQTNGDPNGNVYGWEGCTNANCSGDNIAWCANDDGGGGFLVSDLDPNARVVRLDFAMALHRANHSSEGQAQLVSIQLENNRFIFLEVSGTKFRLGDQYKDLSDPDYHNDFTDLGEVPDDQWAKYRLYIDLNLKVAALQKEGVLSGAVRMLRSEVTTKVQTLRVGLTFAKSDAFRMRFDNVGLKEHE